MVVNPMDYSGKDTVLDALYTERENFYKVIDNPANWNVQTHCAGWEVRDIVGHHLNAIEEIFLPAWDRLRSGEPPVGPIVAVDGIADRLNRKALEARGLPRDEAIDRLKAGSDKVLANFEALKADEWTQLILGHLYMGPIPACIFPMLFLSEYGIHTWDMNWGLGAKDSRLDQRTAGILIPLAFLIRPGTVNSELADGMDIVYGIQVDSEWGGSWKASVKDGQFQAQGTRDLSDAMATFHYKHPSDFVLSAWQRTELSEATGAPDVIQKVRSLFLAF